MKTAAVDIGELVKALQQAHVLVCDAVDELEEDAQLVSDMGKRLGRGAQFALHGLPDAVGWLERLADLLAEHFGVLFLHEAVDG